MSRPPEWWPELAPRIERSRAPKPPGPCIDAHTHLSVKTAAAVAKPFFRPEYEPRQLYSSPETMRYNTEYRASPLNTAQFEDAEQRLADMDAQGVDAQVLAVPPTEYFYWLDETEARRANRLQHERLAEVVHTWPQRFAAVANPPMNHPGLAVETLREAHRDFGYLGAQISADVLGLDLDDRRFDPVWQTVVELDMTVILHPQGFTHGERFSDYYLVNVMCMPLASTLAVTRMILGGVWQRHPDLRVMVVHGGGYLPFYVGRLDHAWKVRPEVQALTPEPPSAYLKRMWFDTCIFRADHLASLVELVGIDKVMLGSDYPFDMGDEDPTAIVNECASLSMSDREKIFSGNARQLFGLS